MREYQDATSLKGEELANEVKEMCPDVLQMRQYYDVWCCILERLDTFPLYDEDFNDAVQWACKFDDDDKGCIVEGLIRKMVANYNDAMNGKRWLEETYSLTSTNAMSDDETNKTTITDNVSADDGKNSTADIPHDVLRLFGRNKVLYEEYINACKGQCPKEIARLYVQEYGRIQLTQEKGVVSTLHRHLHNIGLLTCSLRTFQIHYNKFI